MMKISWAFLKYWNLINFFSCIKKLRECRNCNRNLWKRINIRVCIMHSKSVFLFLELILHGNYCSQQQAIIFPLLPFYLLFLLSLNLLMNCLIVMNLLHNSFCLWFFYKWVVNVMNICQYIWVFGFALII